MKPRNNNSGLLFATLMLVMCVSMSAQDPSVKHQTVTNSQIDLSSYKLTSVYSNDFARQQKIAFERDLIKQDTEGRWHRVAYRGGLIMSDR